ncbi:YdcF family protein [Staphylococcus succinus]|uniref:YdcF family protein n=1 Tax=Staphylococcus TaxID=1279 RepID=UPI00210ABA39|nr:MULTISPECIES: YdcF family protein [Staphylococcus]MEB8123352.1 YdcF family protein [Staphylococcus succinus]
MNIGYHTLPLYLIVAMVIGCLLLHFKHKHLFQERQSVLFIKRLYMLIFKVIIFMVACAYISLIPNAINIIFLWLSAIALSALYTFLCFISTSSRYLNTNHIKHFDIIFVLGAGIFSEQVTPMLANRLDQALTLFRQHPNAHFIVSGGKGNDEPISEALAMRRYLEAQGVDSSRILMEDQSTSTYENIKYTKALIARTYDITPNIVCITSQFHIMRALRFGQKLNLKLNGVGSTTPYHFFEIALIRDFLALMYQYKLLLTIYFASLFLICALTLWYIPRF